VVELFHSFISFQDEQVEVQKYVSVLQGYTGPLQVVQPLPGPFRQYSRFQGPSGSTAASGALQVVRAVQGLFRQYSRRLLGDPSGNTVPQGPFRKYSHLRGPSGSTAASGDLWAVQPPQGTFR
jgi:hypothetical protein